MAENNLLRMDNVGIVVESLDDAIAFFSEIGMQLEGRAKIEGEWAGRVTGLKDQIVEIAMMVTPDGHNRLELSTFLTPQPVSDHRNAPVNSLGYSALADYLALQNRTNTLSAKEREIINLVVSQVNDCKYCVPAHTAVSKMMGFSDEQILEIRRAQISFDSKYDALAKFVKETTVNRGRPSEKAAQSLSEAGYNKANVIDIMMIIGDKIISNYLHNFTQIPVDWPEAAKI